MKIAGFVVYMIASFTDWYDGWHARRFGVITKTGIFLDPLADKILVSFAFIAFYMLGIMPLWMMIVIVIRDIAITLLRSYKESKGVTLKTSYIAKVKTFVQMTYVFLILLIILLIALDVNAQNFTNFLSSELNYILMLSVTLLTVYTGVTYFFENKQSS